MTAALALGSSFGIRVHGFAPRELAIGAEGEHEEWVREAARLRVSNVDGLKCFASIKHSFDTYTIILRWDQPRHSSRFIN